MGSVGFSSLHSISIPMHYAVLLRDLRLSVPVFDNNFNKEAFTMISGALQVLQQRMSKLDHNLDRFDCSMNQLEQRIHRMETRMEKLQQESAFLDHEDAATDLPCSSQIGGDDDDEDDKDKGPNITVMSSSHDRCLSSSQQLVVHPGAALNNFPALTTVPQRPPMQYLLGVGPAASESNTDDYEKQQTTIIERISIPQAQERHA